MIEYRLKLYKPTQIQEEILKKSKGFNRVVFAAGRRAGKSELNILKLSEHILKEHFCAVIFPSYPALEGFWNLFIDRFHYIIKRKDAKSRKIFFINGARVDFWSALRITNIRSNKYHYISFDEAGYIDKLENKFLSDCEPCLLDFNDVSECWFFGSPNGKNDFYKQFIKYKNEVNGWISFQCDSTKNSTIKDVDKFLEQKKKELSERFFRSEYLGEFIDSGSVFNYVKESCTSKLLLKDDEINKFLEKKRTIIGGLDFGRTNDFTFCVLIDADTKNVIYCERFSDIDFNTQLLKIERINKTYKPVLFIAESNSFGSVLIENLISKGLSIQSFNTNNASKREIIETLQQDFENRNIKLPDKSFDYCEILCNELDDFEQNKTASGLITYAAGSGHDDGVIALGLANWGCKNSVIKYVDTNLYKQTTPFSRF